jgi:hypothetical protein
LVLWIYIDSTFVTLSQFNISNLNYKCLVCQREKSFMHQLMGAGGHYYYKIIYYLMIRELN